MKVKTKSVASVALASVMALGASISPIQAAAQDTLTSSDYSENKNDITSSTERILVDDNWVTFNFYEDDTIRKYEVIENGLTTTVEYNKDENIALIDGEVVDQSVVDMIQDSSISSNSLNSSTRQITTFASTGWVSASTVKGSTKLATITASAFAAFLASVVGGPVVSGLIAACSVVIGMGFPEVWFTDKQSFRMTGITLETKHDISFYSNSARTKLIKSYSYITLDTGGPK